MVPSESVEVVASRSTVRSVVVPVNAAVGATLAGGSVTVMVELAVPMAPSSSVTVRPMV